MNIEFFRMRKLKLSLINLTNTCVKLNFSSFGNFLFGGFLNKAAKQTPVSKTPERMSNAPRHPKVTICQPDRSAKIDIPKPAPHNATPVANANLLLNQYDTMTT